MTMRVVATVLNAACDAAVDLIDGGGGSNGVIEFYSGSPPGGGVTSTPAGTLLASVDFAATAFGNAGASNDGEAEAASTPLTTTGADGGTIGFARILDTGQDDAGALWDDDDVGTSGNNITVNTTTVSSGVDFEVTSYVFSAVAQA